MKNASGTDIYRECKAVSVKAAEEGKLLLPDEVVPSYVRNEVAWKKVGEQGKKHPV